MMQSENAIIRKESRQNDCKLGFLPPNVISFGLKLMYQILGFLVRNDLYLCKKGRLPDSIISYSTLRFGVIIATHQPFGSFTHSACACARSSREINKSGIKSEITFMFDFAKSAFTVHWQHNFPTRKKEEVLFLLFALLCLGPKVTNMS